MRLERARQAVWEFLIGDDPLGALLVVASVGVTALLRVFGLNGWPLVPLVALVALWCALRRQTVARPGKRRERR